MHLILALSVIILQQVDLYSCRSVTRKLDDLRFYKSGGDSTQPYEFENSKFADLIQPFLHRIPSGVANKEQHQKNLDKLTIEPYRDRNYTHFKWRRYSPLPRLNKQKKIFGPLAIIVTNLPDITKLKENQYKYLKEKDNLKEIKDEIKPTAVSKESIKYSKPITTEINGGNSNVFDKNSETKSTGKNAQEASFVISKNVDLLKRRTFDEVSDKSNEHILKDDALNHFTKQKDYEKIANDTRSTENKMLYYSKNKSDSSENKDVLVSTEILHDELRSDDQAVSKTEAINETDSKQENNDVEKVLTEKQTSLEANLQTDGKLETQAQDDFITHSSIGHSHENDYIIKRLDPSEGNIDEIERESIINNIDKGMYLDHDISMQLSKQSEADNSVADYSEYIPVKMKEDERSVNNENYKEAEEKAYEANHYTRKIYNISFLFNR